VFDPFAPGAVAWRYDQYDARRVDDPIHRSDLLEGWVLTRWDDVVAVLRDPTATTSEVALGAAVARLDDLAPAGEPAWNNRMVLRSLRHRPIAFAAGGG
jgi:cytochrome P450